MILQTEIKIQPLEQAISYGDGLLFLGSCFADEVGGICRGLGFDALVNPFGVLYNPASILRSVERLHSGNPFCHEEVVQVGEGQFCTFSHNTAFWQSDEQILLETVNNGLKEAHERFLKAKWVVISLGTSWVFRHKETRLVVSNCHKLPARQFDREFLSVEQSEDCLIKMLQAHPNKQFIFTVSPIMHIISLPTKFSWTSCATIVSTRKTWCIPLSRRFDTFGNTLRTLPLTLKKILP